jgi:hypothetical protein
LPLVTSLVHPVPRLLLFQNFTSLKVKSGCDFKYANMKDRTDTLEIGSKASDFSLSAANREGVFTLGGFLAQGPLILEFLRGTW